MVIISVELAARMASYVYGMHLSRNFEQNKNRSLQITIKYNYILIVNTGKILLTFTSSTRNKIKTDLKCVACIFVSSFRYKRTNLTTTYLR